MYAYVKYLSDGQKEIVPLKFVLNLDESEVTAVDSKIIYKIFWTSETEEDSRLKRFESFMKKATFDKNLLNVVDFKRRETKKRGNKPPDGFYEANVLLIKDTIEDIEQIVDEIGFKRVRHPSRKILEGCQTKRNSSQTKRKGNPKLVKKKQQNKAALASITSILNLNKHEPTEVDEATDLEDKIISENEAEEERLSYRNNNLKTNEGDEKKESPTIDGNDEEDNNENQEHIKRDPKTELPTVVAKNDLLAMDAKKGSPATDANGGHQDIIMIVTECDADEKRNIDNDDIGRKEDFFSCKNENEQRDKDGKKNGETKYAAMDAEDSCGNPKNCFPKVSGEEVKEKLNPEFEESDDDDFSSEDGDDDIVPKAFYEKLQQKYELGKEKNVELKKKLQIFEKNFDDFKSKFEKQKIECQQEAKEKINLLRKNKELEKELDKIKEENKSLKRKLENYQELNLNLQNKFFDGIKRFKIAESKSKTDSDPRSPQCSEAEECTRKLAKETLFPFKMVEPKFKPDFDQDLPHHFDMEKSKFKPDFGQGNPHLQMGEPGFKPISGENSPKDLTLNDSDSSFEYSLVQEKKNVESELKKGEDSDKECSDTLNENSETMDLYGYEVEKEKFDLINKKKYNDSKFCQAVAELIWKEKLLERSVTGKKAKKPGSIAKKPLTPQKVEAIRSALREKIKQQEPNADLEQFAIRTSTEKVESYIKTKIYNLKKKKPE